MNSFHRIQGRMRRRVTLLAAACVGTFAVLLPNRAALATARPLCPGGRFMLDDSLEVPTGGVITGITVAPAEVALHGLCEGQPPDGVRLHGGGTRSGVTHRALRFAAYWSDCAGSRVRVSGRIPSSCDQVSGWVRYLSAGRRGRVPVRGPLAEGIMER